MYIRCAGILYIDNKILLVKHAKTDITYWVLPGGKIEVGETVFECAEREFLEETHLNVKAEKIVSVGQLIRDEKPLLDIFISCRYINGEIKLGMDPEPDKAGILKDIRLFNEQDFKKVSFRPHQMQKFILDNFNNNDLKSIPFMSYR